MAQPLKTSMKRLALLISLSLLWPLMAYAEETPAEPVVEEQPAPKPQRVDRLAFSKLPGFLRWIDKDLDRARIATTPPPRDVPRGGATPMEELGRIAFRYPGILGPFAQKTRLSCDVCHPNGTANANFSLGRYSGAPGQIDMTNRHFSKAGDDRVFNPRTIPDLRNAASPFGSINPQPTHEDFVAYTIVTELGGKPPAPTIARALAAYLRALPATKNGDPTTDPLYRVIKGNKGAARMVRIAFDDLDRTLVVLETALKSKRLDIADFVTRAARSEIGRLYERLDKNDPARRTLLIQGTQLKEVPKAAKGENWRGALRLTKRVREHLAVMNYAITTRADLTFFDRLRVRYYLEPELMWEAMADNPKFVPVGGVPLAPEEETEGISSSTRNPQTSD